MDTSLMTSHEPLSGILHETGQRRFNDEEQFWNSCPNQLPKKYRKTNFTELYCDDAPLYASLYSYFWRLQYLTQYNTACILLYFGKMKAKFEL